MALMGLWLSKNEYRVTDTMTGRSDSRLLYGTKDEMADPVYMEEMAHWMRDLVAADWKKEKPQPHTPGQRKEMGSILKEIGASRDYKRDNNHSRWW